MSVRLGIYSDLAYKRDGDVLSAGRAFVRFVAALPPRVDEVVLFGRLDPEPGRAPYELPRERVRLVPLPHYAHAGDVPAVLRAARGSCAAWAAELPRLDAVWVFGPQPLALPFAWLARRRGVPLVLGVRHDYPAYVRHRAPTLLPAALAMELEWRRLARRAPAVALGDVLARRYARGPAPVLATGFSLVPRAELRPLGDALAVPWDGSRTLLSVTRLDREKDPLALLDVLARVRARDTRWRLAVAGDGPLAAAMERRREELGLDGAVELLGEVPNGPALWARYRQSHAFLHVARTEGLPQALLEAQAAGLPVVATAVGGVAAAVGGGTSGVLVRRGDAAAAAAALERLAADPRLREELIRAGLARARDETLEAHLDRLAAFLRRAVAAAP